MQDSDNIDLLYVLNPYGWSTCVLYVGGHVHELYITHVFGDPISDFIEATISLLKGASEVEFVWWGEPGGNRWKMTRNHAQHHRISVTVTEFSSCYGHPIAEEIILAEFEIKISHFSTLVYYQIKKIAALLKEKSFESNRSGYFPYSQFHKLESLFNA